MEVQAKDVKTLREKTGAGMLDCKNALVEAKGDMDSAVKKLKEQGLAAANKRSSRATNEGRVFSLVRAEVAGLLELACETDFVARNGHFIEMGEELLETVVTKGLTEMNPDLERIVQDGISKIKENISLKRFKTIKLSENEVATDYIHGEGNIGVLVVLRTEKQSSLDLPEVKNLSLDCALHVAAFNPLFLSRDSVTDKYLQEQEQIFKKQAETLDKPEKVLAGIAKGKLNKHLKDVVYLDQGFVKEEKRSVEDILKETSNLIDDRIAITDFLYYRVGGD